MAYTPKPKLFDEGQPEQPFGVAAALPTSVPTAGTVSPGTQAPPTKQAPAAPSAQSTIGTGFVNMDRLLGANAGIGGGLLSAGKKAIGEESANLTKKSGNFQKKVEAGAAVTKNDVSGSIDKLFGGDKVVDSGARPGGSPIVTAGVTDEDKNSILSALNAKYTGPQSFNYKTTGALDQARALSNARSAGRQLAANAGSAIEGGFAGYNPTLSALDRALYGNEASAKQATEKLSKGVKNLKGDIATKTNAANASAAKAADDVAKYRAGVADKLRGGAQGIIGNAEAAASAAAAQEAADKAGGVVRDPATGQLSDARPFDPVNNPNGMWTKLQWHDAQSGPTAGNFVGQNAGTLDFIARALNDPTLALQDTGQYKGGYNERVLGQVPTGVAHQPNETPEAILTPEEEADYQKRAGYLKSIGMATLLPMLREEYESKHRIPREATTYHGQ